VNVTELAALIERKAANAPRFIVAVAGPPASGKSTLAASIVQCLGAQARVVPMDGFHFDNRVLAARGRLDRKGAADTFDVNGFRHLLQRLRSGEDQVAIPLFDRSIETSRAGADIVARAHRILIVEGNYLLLDEPPWQALGNFFDLTVSVAVTLDEIEARLRDRWAHFGKTSEEAGNWIESNDLPNARHVISGSRAADVVFDGAVKVS